MLSISVLEAVLREIQQFFLKIEDAESLLDVHHSWNKGFMIRESRINFLIPPTKNL